MKMEHPEQYLWVEKYRPKKVSDIILPDRLKKLFQTMLDDDQIQNMTLSGPPGCGKTTVALALCEEGGYDYKKINGSLDLNKDALRNDIREFAASTSFSGNRKIIIIDEADEMSSVVQPALRTYIEDFSSNCGFILTVNRPGKLLSALTSRCPVTEFRFSKVERTEMIKQELRRIFQILKTEKIACDKKVVLQFVQSKFPDLRKTLGLLESHAIQHGKIDESILVDLSTESIETLMKALRAKSFDAIRSWITDHPDVTQEEIYEKIYDVAGHEWKRETRPLVIVTLAKYQDMASRAINPDINLCGCLFELALLDMNDG